MGSGYNLYLHQGGLPLLIRDLEPLFLKSKRVVDVREIRRRINRKVFEDGHREPGK